MSTSLVAVKHHFSAGHRLPGLEGEASKCSNLHGHTFGVEATWFQPYPLAIEFGAVKKALRGWVNDNLDHGYIVGPEDEVLLPLLQDNDWKHYVCTTWPTTEEIAREIAFAIYDAAKVDGYNDLLRNVVVTEGEHNKAVWLP